MNLNNNPMVSQNDPQLPDRPNPEAQDLPHIRPLPRIPSDLSQTSTLVGSEPSDGRFDEREPPTSVPPPARHGNGGQIHSGGTSDGGAPDMENRSDVREEELDYESARSQAQDSVRELNVMCDTIIALVDDVNTKMGAAERLVVGEEYEMARRLFLNVLRDINRFKFGSS